MIRNLALLAVACVLVLAGPASTSEVDASDVAAEIAADEVTAPPLAAGGAAVPPVRTLPAWRPLTVPPMPDRAQIFRPPRTGSIG